jgi:nitroreductase
MEPTPLPVLDAMAGRHSLRRFLPTPVPRATLEAILATAARAPSGKNSQPWHVHVVTGAARERVSQAVLAAAREGRVVAEYEYFPEPTPEPYLARGRAVGYELYRLYGIERSDRAARARAMLRNFEFFGAPVGLFFSMERRLRYGSWLDLGMFMQNVMLAARAFGLETCPQQAWCEFGDTVHAALGIGAERVVASGMSLGVADPDAPENQLRSEREPLAGFVTFADA